jgi:hypothetical protein
LEVTEGYDAGRICAALPVFWGRRIYILGARDFSGFVNALNFGEEPRTFACGNETLMSQALVRASGREWQDELPPAVGLPLLPEPLASRILKAPLEGRITAVHRDGTADVDIGADHGAFVGMRLEETLMDRTLWSVFVIEVHATTRVISDGDSEGRRRELRLGQPVTCDAKGAAR